MNVSKIDGVFVRSNWECDELKELINVRKVSAEKDEWRMEQVLEERMAQKGRMANENDKVEMILKSEKRNDRG